MRSKGFDALRGVAIIAVVAIHAQFGIVTGLKPIRFAEWTALLLAAVPVFMILSVLFVARETGSTAVIRRLVRLLPLYGIWTGIYLVFSHFVTAGGLVALQPHWSVLEKALGGTAYYHLYFLPALIELLVLSPLVVAGARSWVVLLGGLAFLGAGQFVVASTSHSLLRVLWEEQFVFVWLPAGVAGALLARQKLRVRWPWLWMAAGLAACVAEQHVAAHLRTTATMAYARVGALVLAIGAVSVSEHWARPPSWLAGLGRRSLGVFLVHPIVLRGAWAVTGYRYPIGTYALAVVATVTLSVAIVMALERSPLRPLVDGRLRTAASGIESR